MQQLQWGHGISAVERTRPTVGKISISPLQWGHGISAVESAESVGRTMTTWWGFNGATAFQPWKDDTLYCPFDTFDSLQWGHGISAVESIGALFRLCGACLCFNGATAFQPWKEGC